MCLLEPTGKSFPLPLAKGTYNCLWHLSEYQSKYPFPLSKSILAPLTFPAYSNSPASLPRATHPPYSHYVLCPAPVPLTVSSLSFIPCYSPLSHRWPSPFPVYCPSRSLYSFLYILWTVPQTYDCSLTSIVKILPFNHTTEQSLISLYTNCLCLSIRAEFKCRAVTL